MSPSQAHRETLCVISPAAHLDGFASLSTPVYRASTILFPTASDYRHRADRAPDGYTYGLSGTPTTRALEEQIASLHGARRSIVVPSGQAAITFAMLAILSTGDHLLVADNVYPPVKQFCREILSTLGIEAELFDPADPQDMQARIQPGRTKLVWLESPGSTTMEVADIPELSRLAKASGAFVGCDNTWATGLLCRPLELGADLVSEALTKYCGGHSDLLLGAIVTNEPGLHERIRRSLSILGVGVSPDECSLAIRGIQTMAVRLQHAGDKALQFAARIANRYPFKVLHPALPECAGHYVWKRDFRGSAGVFSIQLPDVAADRIDEAIDRVKTFAIGASWGGTRSIIAPMEIGADRHLKQREGAATYLRVSVGLEAASDLWADLEQMLDHVLKHHASSRTLIASNRE
ncbi:MULTISPECIES: aminotransferase class I/II-fold pyridoxal phosphate-dependent enzyme [unclassified Mesorhizobium]|uniref:trans-sulfuration enzyme family protein n=1 Tax=unclassified Mesorhizobium TaxID=325217 RepID=UPI0024156701|nr:MULTISPECIES: aminotransferase class I/II-fold pyridoxal phosphate-dependent enzyme [unclassified Mesorhizobium]MDG4890105.1 aminotransferase class I/II-fold pyridoxal phosphate-dependent enzyme [Mesorhizobium sp. WSM4887]MDG4904247.1 aminotransferase class I/II-fold pyridoxal phosphate-dependent enzyme [Mesorhizobium sp. WSM4962]MDG4909274.1 aminotransferase class I/II-fold pyridoxal phosphate-dependent enzyme [Mesorhizobium sp. WSM4898]MDG4921898.1 aminotransferase class I/II-fold pyridoxa